MSYENAAFEDSPESRQRESGNIYLVEEDVLHCEEEIQEQGRENKIQEDSRERRARLLKQSLMVSLSSLGMWTTGSVIAFSSVIAYDLETHNTTIYGDPVALSSEELDQLSSLKSIAAIPGACVIALVMTRWGRRLCMAASGVLMVVGWLGIVLLPGVAGMLISRVISGFGIGGLSISINTYVVELADLEVRGTMAAIITIGIIGGQVVTMALGYAFRYYTVGLLLMIFPIVFLLSLVWLPEGPSVLIVQGREEDARKALVRLRGKYADIEAEVQVYKNMNKITEDNRSPWRELVTREPLINLARVCILFVIMHFTGYYVVAANTARIFSEAGSTIDNSIASVIVSSVQLVASAFASIPIDKLGRRKSLIMSYSIMSVPLAVMAAYFGILSDDTQEETNPYGWIPVVCLVISQAAVVLGANPIPFILSNEYFPTFIRPQASSICFVIATFMGFIVLQFYTPMVEGMTLAGLFAFYACSCVAGVPYTFFFIKETRGKHVG